MNLLPKSNVLKMQTLFATTSHPSYTNSSNNFFKKYPMSQFLGCYTRQVPTFRHYYIKLVSQKVHVAISPSGVHAQTPHASSPMTQSPYLQKLSKKQPPFFNQAYKNSFCTPCSNHESIHLTCYRLTVPLVSHSTNLCQHTHYVPAHLPLLIKKKIHVFLSLHRFPHPLNLLHA